MAKLLLDKVINKNTLDEVCTHYTGKIVIDVVCNLGEPLKVKYDNGSSFTHETVLSVDEDDYRVLIETTHKLWKFDY